ncbi:glycosyltransferase family 4 protein [Halosolutus amylolyticus]|uniref:Glycosyltransferase family 4 protein n=1 Tax=Halosolutus amylolyticus TaxID=2932267 RepID=A0ABD5PQN4_9EURY|nr:glycosyltransferase family 4 protein [Halosolutus amylolyticus]
MTSETAEASAARTTTVTSETGEEMQVLHLPYFDTNPYQANLAAALERNGVSVTLTTGYPAEAVRTLFSEGVPDVLHLHWISPYLVGDSRVTSVLKAAVFCTGLLVARLLGVRIVWTAHNLVEHERRYPSFERFCKGLLVEHLFDRVFVHWQEARSELREEFGLAEDGEPFVTVTHGHYIHNYENEVDEETARSRFGIPPDAFVLLFFGGIRSYKGVPELIDAFEALDRDDVHLLIAGNTFETDLHEQIEDMASANPRIHCTLEFVPDENVQWYMNAADAVVFPFEDIFTSGSVILAMSFGKAVVAPRSEYLDESVGNHGGILYDGDDPDGLDAALKEIVDREVDSMGRRNYELVSRHEWETVAAETVAAYREVL